MRLLIALGSAAVLLLSPARPLRAQRTCQPDTLSKAIELRQEAIEFVTDSSWLAELASYGVAQSDSAAVSIVTADSVCEAVTRAVDSAATPPRHRSTALIVVRFEKFYAAVSPDTAFLDPVYILDDQFRILFLLSGT